ncbi:iron-sulfur protein [Clostridia bacterium]|nr:iron-sulfur protein [Clostridia bacterium]
MMNIIFYFTGTGNSLKAAREIAAVLGDTKLAAIPDHFGVDLFDYERIGFIYPIYFGGIPLIVKDFVKSLKIPKSVYLFAVATYGGGEWNGLKQINALLTPMGQGLDYGTVLQMGSNYILRYSRSENVDSVNAVAAKKLSKIAVSIRDRESRPCGKLNPLMSLPSWIFRCGVRKTVLKYHVSDDCTSCGLCAKICSVRNIKIKDGKPKFGDHCEQCLACLQWCPQKAINYRDKTKQRERYHHPDISVKDLMRKEELR